MNSLLIENINKTAPYTVVPMADGMAFEFFTKHDIHYSVSFLYDDTHRRWCITLSLQPLRQRVRRRKNEGLHPRFVQKRLEETIKTQTFSFD